MKKNIGFMQGRLSPIYKNKIQCFPKFHWDKEFKIANKLGLKIMEWTLDYEGLLENPLLKSEGQEKIKSLSQKYKIVIPSVTGDCFMEMPYWKEKKLEIKEQLDIKFDLICKACKLLEIKYLVIPLVDNGRIENNYHKEVLIEWLNSKLNFLKDCKLTILFESEYPPKNLRDFISNFPETNFGINYDIGNSASFGYECDIEFAEYGERIRNVHVKDRKLGGNTVPLGLGNADFRKVFNNLNEINYEGNFIMQAARANNGDHSFLLNKYRIMIETWINELKIGI
tara:strand:- start:8607 stop:9455 length:849 start_codon:yes stop_codon:yes gene_type:complete